METQTIKLTPRSIAKQFAASAVGVGAATLTARGMDNHTNFDKDAYVVKLAAGMVGYVVATTVQPFTDKAVDATFDFVIAKRESWRSQKDAKKDK